VELGAMSRGQVSCVFGRVVLRHGTWLPDEVAGAELNFLPTDDCDGWQRDSIKAMREEAPRAIEDL